MLSDAIKPLQQAYFFLEDHYYHFLDVLEQRFSIPVYEKFVTPIEEKGVPSLLVVALFLLMLVGIALLTLLPTSGLELTVVVQGKAESFSSPLDGALVEVSDGSKTIFSETTRKGRTRFSNAPAMTLEIIVSKKGFVSARKVIDTTVQQNVRFELACTEESACAEVLRNRPAAGLSATPEPTPSIRPQRFPGKPGQSEVTFSNPEPESTTGKLLLVVRDPRGNPVKAKAKVYDFDSAATLGSVDVSGGSGLMLGLKAGKKVYVNIIAQGFKPYEGKKDAFVVKPATNKVKVVLEDVGPVSEDVRFLIVTSQEKPIENAEISIRSLNSSEALQSVFSDAEGKASVSVGKGSYYAVASKPGFVTNYSTPFKAGETVRIMLSNLSEVPLVSLDARVIDNKGEKIPSANVVVLEKTSFGTLFVLMEMITASDGTASFTNLPKGIEVELRATYNDLFANASLILLKEKNNVTLTLKPKPFFIKAFAYDPIAKNYLAAPVFESYFNSQKVHSCTGNGCILEVKNGFEVTINASAEGYTPAKTTLLLTEGVDQNVTLYMVSLDALKDSFVQWTGLFDANNRPLPSGTYLKPGHAYQARLQLFAKNADTTGIVFSTGHNQIYLNKHEPLGFAQKGAALESCFGSDVQYGEFNRFAWVDVSYRGSFTALVAFNFTVDPAIELDASTKTKTVSLRYRSYITRGGEFVRNPFDPILLSKPDPENPSGCNVPHYVENVTVKSTSTSCAKEGCVSLLFVQGEESGSEDFPAKSQVVLWNESYTPVRAIYSAEIFSDFNTANLKIEAPAKHFVIWNATNPIIGESPVAQGKKQCDFSNGKIFDVGASSLVLPLSDLKKCSNFALPLRIEGIAVGRVLEPGKTDVQATLAHNEKVISHTSSMKIQGFGIAADENSIVEARLHQPRNTFTDQEHFPVISTSTCTAEKALQGACEVGALNITFRITALKEGTSQTQVSSPLLPAPILLSPLPSGVRLQKGQSIQGEAHFLVPITQGDDTVEVVHTLNNTKTTLSRAIKIGGENLGGGGSKIFPPGWDTCNGLIEIRYEPGKNPPFSVGKGCTDLGMRISTIFPADAAFLNVSLPNFGQVVTGVSKTDGSHTCYEICQYDKDLNVFGCQGIGKQLETNAQYLLRYNPDLLSSCPTAYKSHGNQIGGSQITVEFAYTQDQTAKRNVTVRVLPDTSEKSIYISPVFTFYLGGLTTGISPRYPQLWAAVNHKQIGKRELVIKEPSNLLLSFNGPGVQVFAVTKDSLTGRVLVYEAPDLENPILDTSSANSPIKAISEYGQEFIRQRNQIQSTVNLPPEEQARLNAEMEQASQNSFLEAPIAESIINGVPVMAQKAMYWRSSDITLYCQQKTACTSSLYTLEGCCKNSFEAWKNYSITRVYRTETCTFCNNTVNPSCTDTSQSHLNQYAQCTYNPAPRAFQCDQRCTAKSRLSTETLRKAELLGVTASGLTIDLRRKGPLPYGETVDGRTCEMFYSSLNSFVSSGTNVFSRYNPSMPLRSISPNEVQRCLNNGDCPLILSSQTVPGFPQVSASQQPQCVVDANNNGLKDPGEVIQNTIFATRVDQFGSSQQVYQCTQGIIAVDANLFFKPALQGARIALRTSITSSEVQRCRQGHCPLMYGTFPVVGEAIVCFKDYDGNSFYDYNNPSEVASGELGPRSVFGEFVCPQGKIPAISSVCVSGCENYCDQPRCDPSTQCSYDGTKYIPSGEEQKTFVGWINESVVVEVPLKASYLSRGFERAPASFFTDLFQEKQGKPLFSHSFIVDSRGRAAALTSLSKVVGVSGCGDGADPEYGVSLLPNEGLYKIRSFNTIDALGHSWASEAKAVEVQQEKYSAASRANLCRKPSWNVRLCEVAYNDVSAQYAGCFNSILKFTPGPKKLGAQHPLIGGLGFGGKNGLGYGISPGGQVFALFEPTRVNEFCEGENRVREERQTLYHWDPDGRTSTSKEFFWRQSRCDESCGCKKKSYGYFQSFFEFLGFGQSDDKPPSAGSTTFSDTGVYGISPHCQQWPIGDTIAYGCKGVSWAMNPSGGG